MSKLFNQNKKQKTNKNFEIKFNSQRNLAAVPLFTDTNMTAVSAAVTPRANTALMTERRIIVLT